jgi:toxin ParE1/3/4
MYQLEIKPRAITTSREAYAWYEAQKDGLGERFLEVLTAVLKKIEVHPELFSKVKKSYRQARLHRFPYVVIYEIMDDKVVVLMVFHTSRRPSSRFSG